MKTQMQDVRLLRLASFLTLLLAVCGHLSVAQADSNALNPGGSILPVASGPGLGAGATLLFSTNVTWATSSTSISGTLISDVYANDSNNPYGGLTFTYQLTLSSNSLHTADYFAISSYAGIIPIDVTSDGTSSGQAPLLATRSQAATDGGEDVNFNFGAGISPGGQSTVIDIDTATSLWFPGIASVTDDLTAPDIATLGPAIVPVPEPSEIGLMMAGGFCVLGCVKCWRKLN
jgi:hypothetical protein